MSKYGLVTSSAKLIPTQSRYKESDERKVKHNQKKDAVICIQYSKG